ncbi:hypothetical protein QAD02_010006 [Eretmocerus hayati]|uniref:Uncharacterized protein n=1 Tax=Eretmocerus hayati TaxID=131215 RepID=A0ACC2NC48_9HYME|nr:hypothetical protein QAD02_010006 [Eretmocerus hayati]
MTSSGIKIPTILLLCPFFLSLGVSAETVKRSINLDEINDNMSDLVTRGDGSLVFVTSKQLYEERRLECVIHVIGLSGPEITYPISYKGIADVEISFDMVENVTYVLLKDSTLIQQRVTVFAVDLISGEVSKLDLPTGLIYKNNDINLIIDYNGANLIFNDPSVCGNHIPPCKFTFNKRGEHLSGPISFPIENGYLKSFPRLVKSADEGVLVFQAASSPQAYSLPNEQSEAKSFYINASGYTTILHRFPNLPRIFFDDGDIYVACAFNTPKLDALDCALYDWKLNETIALTLLPNHFGEQGGRFVASVASLEKSKFLVTYFECGRNHKPRCKTARVSSINSDGKLLKTMQLFNDLDTDANGYGVMPPAIVKLDDQFCFYIIYYVNPDFRSADYQKFLNVHTKCIPKSEL